MGLKEIKSLSQGASNHRGFLIILENLSTIPCVYLPGYQILYTYTCVI